jgi:hypothetical protein
MIATYGRGYNFINSICGQAVGKSCGGVSSAFISFMPIHQIITTRMQSAHVRTSRRNQCHHSNDPSIENYSSNISTHKGDNDNKYQKQVNQERLGRRQLRREKELRREKQLAVISIILFAVVVFSIVILYYVWKSREVKIIRKERHPPNPFEHVASTSSSSITARDHQREKEIYDQWSQGLQELNEAILSDNVSRSDILLNPRLLGFPDGTNNPLLEASSRSTHPLYPTHGPFFRISRMFDTLPWQENVDCVNFKPFLDYTDSSLYEYPSLSDIQDNMKGYPKLSTLDDVLAHWPQDEIDHPPLPIQETLQHFDYTKPTQLEEAWKYLHQQLPFKLTNVPELVQANEKWTDEYVAQQFDTNQATGSCQESPMTSDSGISKPWVCRLRATTTLLSRLGPSTHAMQTRLNCQAIVLIFIGKQALQKKKDTCPKETRGPLSAETCHPSRLQKTMKQPFCVRIRRKPRAFSVDLENGE